MSVMLIEAGLFALLDSPAGQTGRYVTAKSEAIAAFARDNINTNFRSRTGALAQSIGVFPVETGQGLAYEVGTGGGGTNERGVPVGVYGRVLEVGGEEHLITPVEAHVLRSVPGNPDPLRAPQHYVLHPGPQARPWLKPACYQAGFTDA